ncbi:MAG: FAD-dependent oxidoreductase [Pseudomonadota bacterium]
MAIIGAGLAGLTLAKELQARFQVQVFEKSRHVGGRMASSELNGYQFDHGAQYFIARSAPFKNFLQPFIAQGHIARWDVNFVEIAAGEITQKWKWDEEYPHYVATPTMRALAEAMTSELVINHKIKVKKLTKTDNQWQLFGENNQELGLFDWVITAIPSQQVTDLIPHNFNNYGAISRRKLKGCYSLMLGYQEDLSIPWDAALIKDADISWVCNNHTKPGRPKGHYSLLVHSTNRWADSNMDLADEAVIEYLMRETSSVLKLDLQQAELIDLHRWRYANISRHEDFRSCIDSELQLGAIGDWCIKGRVEAAYLSAIDAADKLLLQ